MNSSKTNEIPATQQITTLESIIKKAINSESKLLLNGREAASLVGIGKSMWYQLHSENRVPKPVRLNKRIFWKRNDILSWVQADCLCR